MNASEHTETTEYTQPTLGMAIPRPEYKANCHYPAEKLKYRTDGKDDIIKTGQCYFNLKNPERCPQCSNDHARVVSQTFCMRVIYKNHAIGSANIYFCDGCRSEYMVADAYRMKPEDERYRCPNCGYDIHNEGVPLK